MNISRICNSARHLLKADYLMGRKWKEMERMDHYLQKALEVASRYIAQTKLSPEEEGNYRFLKSWFQTKYVPQTPNLIPFHKLEAVGKTDGENQLTAREAAFYLEHGVVGPIGIESLPQEGLRVILDKFTGFHKTYNRNLGSVYSMLKHPCLLEVATNKELLSKVSSILGNNIMLCNYTINELAPGMGKSTIETGGMVDSLNCHSDLASGSQYHFEPGTNQIQNLTLDNRCVNVWLSISGTDERSAPLYFFPGTHHFEITSPFTLIDRAKNPEELDHILKLLSFKHGTAPRRIGLYNVEFRELLSDRYRDIVRQILRTEIYTQPGDCIFFNAHTRHGSAINASRKTRLAVTLRFNTAMTETGGLENAGSVVTQAERRELGIEGDKRRPMIQLLGDQHHPNNLPIQLEGLGKNK